MSVSNTVAICFFCTENENAYYQEQVFKEDYLVLNKSEVPSRAHHHTVTWHTVRQKNENVRVWRRESFITEPTKENRWLMPPQTPNSWRVSAKHFKRQGEGGVWLVGANFLVWESFVLAAVLRSGHHVPVNLQQDKYYSLFCNFLFLNEWATLYLTGQSLENGLPCIFQEIGNILLVINLKQKQ